PDHPRKFDFSFETAQSIEEIKKLIVEEVKNFQQSVRKAEEARRGGGSRRQSFAPGAVRRGSFEHIPRFEDQLHSGPTNFEEELHMRNLSIHDD
ncbi:hypothetical protein HK405_007205, partial [Cladochytrium tenue]